MVFTTSVLLAQVHILWYYTPTQLRMYVYTYTAAHIHEGCVWTYTNVYEHAHRSMGAEHPLVVWDGILSHVGGLASVSSAYTLYGIPHNSTALKISVWLGIYTHSLWPETTLAWGLDGWYLSELTKHLDPNTTQSRFSISGNITTDEDPTCWVTRVLKLSTHLLSILYWIRQNMLQKEMFQHQTRVTSVIFAGRKASRLCPMRQWGLGWFFSKCTIQLQCHFKAIHDGKIPLLVVRSASSISASCVLHTMIIFMQSELYWLEKVW